MNESQIEYLKLIRLYELEKVLNIIDKEKGKGDKIKILEIGAGAGWQAKKMFECGYSVEAIDIAQSNYLEQRVWEVKNYDGRNIPFPDYSFDVVFSSSVLEHIANLKEFQKEIKRVLKDDGIAVHIVPGTAWRFWTNISHYPFLIKEISRLALRKFSILPLCNSNEINAANIKRTKKELFLMAAFPCRHGERGNSLSELYYFSKSYWKKLFEISGWKIKNMYKNKIFYTGYMVLGVLLSITTRRYLSILTESACYIFVLNKRR